MLAARGLIVRYMIGNPIEELRSPDPNLGTPSVGGAPLPRTLAFNEDRGRSAPATEKFCHRKATVPGTCACALAESSGIQTMSCTHVPEPSPNPLQRALAHGRVFSSANDDAFQAAVGAGSSSRKRDIEEEGHDDVLEAISIGARDQS